jgi:hypothetical protein
VLAGARRERETELDLAPRFARLPRDQTRVRDESQQRSRADEAAVT